jgi:DNA repair exonuclease SbcCD ATPase subunit
MENQKKTAPEKKNNNRIWIILLALSAILNIYQWQDKNTVVAELETRNDSLMTAKMDIEKELGETYQELNQYKGINERLDSLLAEANGNIEQQRSRIEQLLKNEKNSAALNKKLRAELEDLKKLRDEYLDKIDKLLVENEQLKAQNQELASTVESLSKNLESTVNQAAVLKSEYVRVKAFRKRGSTKYSETAMAKKTNKLEVCFSILDNKFAKAGEKNVYLRVVEPGGKTMGNRSSGSSTFTIAGTQEEVQYTSTTTMNYNNERQDLCLNWEEAERVYAPGTYVIEIYVDGSLSAATSYVLK